MLTQLIPWPYQILAMAILAAALVGFGWVKGAAHVQAKADTYQGQVAAAGAAQANKTAATKKTQSSITANTEATYVQGDPALSNHYGPGRVRKPDAGRRSLPAVPGAATGPDAAPADPGPGAQLPVAGEDLCAGLRSDAAVTTRQLLFLQDWVERQREAMSLE